MKQEKQKVVVAALIQDEEERILLQKRVDPVNAEAHGKWEFPGGIVEFGEDPKDAVIRECKEEMMCTIKIIRLLPYLHTQVWHKIDGQTVQVFVSCFEAEIIEGIPKPGDLSEVSEVKWFTREEAVALDSLPGTNEFIALL